MFTDGFDNRKLTTLGVLIPPTGLMGKVEPLSDLCGQFSVVISITIFLNN